MVEEDINKVLYELRSKLNEILSKVNRICRHLDLEAEVRDIEPQKNHYYETEIPEIDELDRINMKKKEEWARKTY